jgi:glycosyltransferase involved in cell wall biosynthesis
MKERISVSLVIPVYNEGDSIAGLIKSIRGQSLQPDEIILVDGGSTDNTVQLILDSINNDPRFRIISIERAMPGKGRNEGTRRATHNWIAYTDAGIKLHPDWLKELVKKAEEEPTASFVYGNYSPQINTLFDKCAAIAYVPPLLPGKIRGVFIASSMIKKEVWEKTGGFPDWRAAEDLAFMKKAEQIGYQSAFALQAFVYWQLRPGLISTFKRFDLYSKWNVWAGKQSLWHYGVARQYVLVLIALLLAIFHSGYWLLAIPIWLLARVVKRILLHRHEFGTGILFNPAVIFILAVIRLTIDAATFSGWIKALLNKRDLKGS